MTGHPASSASIMTSPNGSSQRSGTSSARTVANRRRFAARSTAGIQLTPGARSAGSSTSSYQRGGASSGCGEPPTTIRSPARRAASTATSGAFTHESLPRKKARSPPAPRSGYIDGSRPWWMTASGAGETSSACFAEIATRRIEDGTEA